LSFSQLQPDSRPPPALSFPQSRYKSSRLSRPDRRTINGVIFCVGLFSSDCLRVCVLISLRSAISASRIWRLRETP
jgi:hypothetical protein